MVCTFEPTSILNAYSFPKTALFRLIYRSFPAKSEEGKPVEEFVYRKLEGSSHSVKALLRRPDSRFAHNVDQIARRLIEAPVLRPPVLYEEDEDLTALSRGLASD